jgi:hypothetical protein
MSAMKIAAGKMKVALPPDAAIDAEVDVGTTRDAFASACWASNTRSLTA